VSYARKYRDAVQKAQRAVPLDPLRILLGDRIEREMALFGLGPQVMHGIEQGEQASAISPNVRNFFGLDTGQAFPAAG
jgi:hypothetical protein